MEICTKHLGALDVVRPEKDKWQIFTSAITEHVTLREDGYTLNIQMSIYYFFVNHFENVR